MSLLDVLFAKKIGLFAPVRATVSAYSPSGESPVVSLLLNR
jgi:hypothetical protein